MLGDCAHTDSFCTNTSKVGWECECKKLGVYLATWVCGNKKKQMGILFLDAMKRGKIHKKN